MNKKSAQNKNILLLIPIITICTFSAIFIAANEHKPAKYMWIWLLPVSFMVFSILCNRVYLLLGRSITITLLISLMFFKNVLVPCIMASGDGTFLSQIDTRPKMLYAIGLDIYEEFAIFFLINIMYKKLKKSLTGLNLKPLTFQTTKIRSFYKITGAILFVVLLCILCYPQLLSYFSIGISGDTLKNISLNRLRMTISQSVPSLIYYTYILFVNILRWILPISVIYKLYISNAFSEKIKIIVSLFIVCFSAILTTEVIAMSVFIAVALTLFVSRIYIKYRKKILIASLGTISLIGISALFIKSFGSGDIQSTGYGQISSMMQAYFSGLENIAIAGMISEPVSLNEVIGDIFRFIPFVMHFFKDFITSNIHFNYIYFEGSGTVTQIIPMISQGARYFSIFFAPIFTIIFCWSAARWEIRACTSNTLFDYTLCVIGCVCFSMSVVMYSASLGLQLYLSDILPIQFIIWFIHRFTIGKNYNYELIKEVNIDENN